MFSQELRLSGSTDDVVWIAGLYYSKDEMDEYYHYFMSDSVFGLGSIPFGVGLFAPTPIVELDTIYEQETESMAVFGHVEWQFTEKWRLTAGLRYTRRGAGLERLHLRRRRRLAGGVPQRPVRLDPGTRRLRHHR